MAGVALVVGGAVVVGGWDVLNSPLCFINFIIVSYIIRSRLSKVNN